jgi:omega-6 fatty acid desaturase (delta-12 desaturase)
LENANMAAAAQPDAREWGKRLQAYCEPTLGRSLIEIVLTVLPFAALWVVSWLAYEHVGLWLSLLLAVPAGAFLVRFFLIQHDCGHYAFFKGKRLNDWVGRVMGIFTMTPYAFWQRCHAIHHASHGNLERRGIGDIDTLTVAEYQSRSWLGKLAYRVYRNPIVLFVIGPAYLFLIQHRLPVTQMTVGWRPWVSAMTTNLGIAAVFGAMMWLVGVKTFLVVHIPIIMIAASIGVWMFYVQHQFEDTVWDHDGTWEMKSAALYGSSHYDLPQPLRWMTANIGVHHVHHLVSRIPFYRLHEAIEDNPELAKMGRITIGQSLKTVKLTLWDESKRKMVTFREAAAVA